MNFKRYMTIVLLFISLFATPASSQNLELQVKAAFIEKFTHFIQWPPFKTATTKSDTFRILILGKSPITPLVKEIFSDNPPQHFSHVLVDVKPMLSWDDFYHIVFIPASYKVKLREIISITEGKPVLTIGDTPGYGENGVIINLYKSEETIRFEINYQALQRSNLEVSSRLLKLARILKWVEVR